MGATATMLAVLAAAGCGGSSGGGASSTASPTTKGVASGQSTPPQTSAATSSSTTTSPTPASSGTAAGAPGVPEPARQHTKAGAKAFAEYFYSRVNILYRKPANDAIHGLYKSSCTACISFENDASDMRKNGRHFIDDQMKYKTLRETAVPGGDYHVFVWLTQNPARMVDSAGKVLGKTPTPTSTSVVLLNWVTGHGWVVEDLQHE